MNNPCMNFNRTTKEFDRICAVEVYPAIVKAFGALQAEKQDDLLFAAADHLAECVKELCFELRDVYLHGETDQRTVKAIKDYLETRAAAAKEEYRERWKNGDPECQPFSDEE